MSKASLNDPPAQGFKDQSSPQTSGDTSRLYNPTNVGPTAVYTMQPTATLITIQPTPVSDPPADGLAFSIFVMLCCCCPLGLVGCMKSRECRTAILIGDRAEAERLSKESRRYSIIGLVIGIIFIIMITVLKAVGVYFP
ncbi:hypothetical protein LSAT2_023690 [Lamellibrachia satsuma]|nr:hypothetical protein LSAT2_023690 [Lamellibrachia satsuma]